MKKFILDHAEIRNDDPFNEGDTYPVSPKPDKESLKVPYNLALNTYDISLASNHHELTRPQTLRPPRCGSQALPFRQESSNTREVGSRPPDHRERRGHKRRFEECSSPPTRPDEDRELTTPQEICNVHNRPAETEPEPAPEAPAPPPNTAGCKLLKPGFGAGDWEITGSGWGDEASLREKFGDWAFGYTGGDSFTATFTSAMETVDVEKAVREMSGLGDVTCT